MKTPAWLQRATTWMAIFGYALVASGLPLPVGVSTPRDRAIAASRHAAKDHSRPFPCMDKPCGCATAEQCFANCCCHTPAERLAWARAHAVEPTVVAALERRVAAAAEPAPEGSCCAVKRKPTCCTRQDEHASAAADGQICRDYRSLAATAEDGPAKPSAEPSREIPARTRGVILKAMLACGGILAEWCAAAAALPPPIVDSPLTFPCIERLALVDDEVECPPTSPAAPPPRAA